MENHIIDFDKNHYPNIEDFTEHFWKHDYKIMLTSQGITFYVNADCEQDAIDYIVDYCEENLTGLIMSYEDEQEEDSIEEYIQGGNHGRYLNTRNIFIEEI